MTDQACTCEGLRLAEPRIAELEGGFRAILLADYRGNKPPCHRIAEECLGIRPKTIYTPGGN